MFKTWLDNLFVDTVPELTVTPCGSDTRNEFTRGFENGISVPVKVGSYSIPEYINSFREGCELQNLVENFVLVNGCSPFEYFQATGKPIGDLPLQFGDITMIPDNRIDFVNQIKYGQNWFNSLDSEFRQAFNNSIDVFLERLGTPEFDNILNSFLNPVEPDTLSPEVTTQDIVQKGGALNE